MLLYLEAPDDFPIFLSSRRLFLKISTEIKREDIIQSLMAQKIVIIQETSSMNVDYFRYLVLAGNFLNFRLCEIQFGKQCLLGEHEPSTNDLIVYGFTATSNQLTRDVGKTREKLGFRVCFLVFLKHRAQVGFLRQKIHRKCGLLLL